MGGDRGCRRQLAVAIDDGLDGALHAEDARVIIRHRQDLPGQVGQVLSGRQVAVIVRVLACLALTQTAVLNNSSARPATVPWSYAA